MTADAYDYIPVDLRPSIPQLHGTADQSDPPVWVKLFTPDSSWSWYVMEWDGEDICFGFVVGHEPEFGHFSLSEIRDVRGRFGLRVERDLHFTPRPLSQVPLPGHA